MAVNGIGGQSLPIANTFQPGGTDEQVRQQQSQPKDNKVQPQGAAAAGVQNSETGNQNILRAQEDAAFSATGSQQRGSLLDIKV